MILPSHRHNRSRRHVGLQNEDRGMEEKEKAAIIWVCIDDVSPLSLTRSLALRLPLLELLRSFSFFIHVHP